MKFLHPADQPVPFPPTLSPQSQQNSDVLVKFPPPPWICCSDVQFVWHLGYCVTLVTDTLGGSFEVAPPTMTAGHTEGTESDGCWLWLQSCTVGECCMNGVIWHQLRDSTLWIQLCHHFFIARCYAEGGIVTVSRLSVRPSITLMYCDHIGWNTSKIISRLVSLGCSLSADPNNTDLIQRRHPKILTQTDPPPVELSVADIRWQIAVEWLEIAHVHNEECIGNHHRFFPMVWSITPYKLQPTLPSKWGS